MTGEAMARRSTDTLRHRVPAHLPDAAHAEKLITEDLPAVIDEFLSRLPGRFRVRRRRRWIRRVAVLAGVVGLGAVVVAVARVPALGLPPRRDDEV